MDLSGIINEEAPELARFEVKMFRWRIGKMFDQEGTFAGITIELYMTHLPWFKIRLPFTRLEGAHFLKELAVAFEDEDVTEEPA